MKTTQQLEHEIDLLKRTGMDLYERAEQWRAALEEIRKMNRCPVISAILKQHLNT